MQMRVINYKPVFIKIKRWLRFAIICVVAVCVFNVYVSGFAYVNVYKAVEEAQRSYDNSGITQLNETYNTLMSERDNNLELVNALSHSNDGISLDKILSVASEYKPYGINILTINSKSVAGYGTELDIVTQFIKKLSDELGSEVDVGNILRLKLFNSAIGFELLF